MRSSRQKLTLEERRRYRNVPVVQAGKQVGTIKVTRFEDYAPREESGLRKYDIPIVVGIVVCATCLFIGLAKMGVLPNWLVTWAMPRIYN